MITDAKERDMTRHVYDMTGQLCYTFNIDSGRRWIIVNALDKPLHTWDNLLRKTTIQYDALNRPLATLLLQQQHHGAESGSHYLRHFRDRLHHREAGYHQGSEW